MISKEEFELLRQCYEDASDNLLLLEQSLEWLVFGKELCSGWKDDSNLESWISLTRQAIDEAVENGIDADWISHTEVFRQLRQAERIIK